MAAGLDGRAAGWPDGRLEAWKPGSLEAWPPTPRSLGPNCAGLACGKLQRVELHVVHHTDALVPGAEHDEGRRRHVGLRDDVVHLGGCAAGSLTAGPRTENLDFGGLDSSRLLHVHKGWISPEQINLQPL